MRPCYLESTASWKSLSFLLSPAVIWIQMRRRRSSWRRMLSLQRLGSTFKEEIQDCFCWSGWCATSVRQFYRVESLVGKTEFKVHIQTCRSQECAIYAWPPTDFEAFEEHWLRQVCLGYVGYRKLPPIDRESVQFCTTKPGKPEEGSPRHEICWRATATVRKQTAACQLGIRSVFLDIPSGLLWTSRPWVLRKVPTAGEEAWWP